MLVNDHHHNWFLRPLWTLALSHGSEYLPVEVHETSCIRMFSLFQVSGATRASFPVTTHVEVRTNAQDSLYLDSTSGFCIVISKAKSLFTVSNIVKCLYWEKCVFQLCHPGPSEWKNIFPNCGGQRQSPINIVTRKVKHDSKLTSFIFEGHEKVFNMSVENHGHSGRLNWNLKT